MPHPPRLFTPPSSRNEKARAWRAFYFGVGDRARTHVTGNAGCIDVGDSGLGQDCKATSGSEIHRRERGCTCRGGSAQQRSRREQCGGKEIPKINHGSFHLLAVKERTCGRFSPDLGSKRKTRRAVHEPTCSECNFGVRAPARRESANFSGHLMRNPLCHQTLHRIASAAEQRRDDSRPSQARRCLVAESSAQ